MDTLIQLILSGGDVSFDPGSYHDTLIHLEDVSTFLDYLACISTHCGGGVYQNMKEGISHGEEPPGGKSLGFTEGPPPYALQTQASYGFSSGERCGPPRNHPYWAYRE